MTADKRTEQDAERLAWLANERLSGYASPGDPGAEASRPATSPDDLYGEDGSAFVGLAFRTFLKREPTAGEAALYLRRLQAGARKGAIAAELRYCREANGHDQPFALNRERFFLLLDRIPLLGGIAGFCHALAGVAGIKQSLLAQQQGFSQMESELGELRAQARGLCRDMIAGQGALADELRQEVQVLRDRTTRLQDSIDRLEPRAGNADSPAAMDDDFYLAFEAHFRGAEEEIRERLRYYLPLIGENLPPALAAEPMADIGCGRGEWLDLLSAAGYRVTGVDLNERNIAACRARDLRADRDDGIAWLQKRESRSLALISSFHVIEHLALPQLISFLVEALRCLKPGGLLILETPNPENLITAAHRFYTDPSHRNPVPPDFTEFLLKYTGFTGVAVHRLHPPPASDALPGEDAVSERLNALLYGPQDYAAIAFKP